MVERVCWVKTSEELFFAIYMKHKEEMCIFGTCTAPEGDLSLGKNNPFVLTEWGFSSSDYPLIKEIRAKKSLDQKEWDKNYFIACLRD